MLTGYKNSLVLSGYHTMNEIMGLMCPGITPALIYGISRSGKNVPAGIGLSLCKKIIRRHSRGMQVKHSAGEGSAFTVTLPVKQNNGGTYGYENTVDYHIDGG